MEGICPRSPTTVCRPLLKQLENFVLPVADQGIFIGKHSCCTGRKNVDLGSLRLGTGFSSQKHKFVTLIMKLLHVRRENGKNLVCLTLSVHFKSKNTSAVRVAGLNNILCTGIPPA